MGAFHFHLLHLYVTSPYFIIKKNNSEAIFSLKEKKNCSNVDKEDRGLRD